MTHKDFETIKTIVLAELDELNPHLTYHSKEHTIDVIEQSVRIALSEGIDDDALLLLKFAALFHDSGFLQTYAEHEKKGCELFLKKAADWDFTVDEKKIVEGLIMATKIPQTPHTHLQQIICDADLDYLGRADFLTIGDTLRREFLHYKIVANNEDWENLQLKFLKNHQYHTKASQHLREPVKQKNYKGLL